MKTIAKLFAAVLLVASPGSALATVLYVDVNSTNATPPFISWATAATNIQDAVDAAVAGDEIVVTNGIYAAGGRGLRGANRVVVDKPLALRSVNGSNFTTVDGGGGARCMYLTDDASLSGFTLTNGNAPAGGGAIGGTLNNCNVTGNSASGGLGSNGGGVQYCTLNNCTLSANSCQSEDGGGGASYSTLNNCIVNGNRATFGGGASGCTLNNCTLTGNSAFQGGGAYGCTLNNCTLAGNSASSGGGGASFSTLTNCIVYFNTCTNGANHFLCGFNYSCTTPLPTNGVGNITNEPAFVNLAAGNYRLRPDSLCIDAGTNLSASITNDLDGRPRPLDGNGDGLAAFDMGAYEYRTPLLVWQDSPNPAPPHAEWASAAHTIQDAVDVAVAGDEIVVTNGIYATGGRALNHVLNRVMVDKPLTLRSVNGPQFTAIHGANDGSDGIRCVYLATGASLSGFTLTNGYLANGNGAGVLCQSPTSMISNSVIAGNIASADVSDGRGGGAFGGTLNNCMLSGNLAAVRGGGAYRSTLNKCALSGNGAQAGGGVDSCMLNNCTLSGNTSSAGYGGGAYGSTLNNCTVTRNSTWSFGAGVTDCALSNCIVYYNITTSGENFGQGTNYDSFSTLNYSCTTPLPTNGVGNITNAPLFVDTNGWADLRLQPSSPCINAGLNVFAPAGPDLDGNPRIVDGTVDIGAYEYQSLDLLGFGVVANQFGFTVTGQSNWVIVLEASSDFTNWTPLATNTFGVSPFPFRDPTAPNSPQRFYRARLQ